MRKKITVLFMAVVMLFSCTITCFAEGGDGDAETDVIDATKYYYYEFDNDAYRNVYDQLASSAKTFHESATMNASVVTNPDGTTDYIAFNINVTQKNWEVINAGGMQLVLNAFIADNPMYFWISDKFTYQTRTTENNVFYNVDIYCYKEYSVGSTRQILKNSMELTISDYANMASADKTDYENEYIIHNAIIDDASYSETYTTPDQETAWAFSIDGICNVRHKSGTSFAYARTFKAVMDELGIPCIYVEGNEYTPEEKDAESYNSHAWNCVYLDNEWYIIDLAYDDPETTTEKDVLTYKYFNVTSDKASNLKPNYDTLPGIPTCNGTAYSIENIQSGLEKNGLWKKDNYNFLDHALDTYGVSIVLISIGLILLLLVLLVKHIHKRGKKKSVEKIKNTKVTVVDHSDLEKELKKPPLS